MKRQFTICLGEFDLGQAIDGLTIRAEVWEKTAEYLRNGKLTDEEFFLIEECNSPEEAERIAEHYRSIIAKIRQQMEDQ